MNNLRILFVLILGLMFLVNLEAQDDRKRKGDTEDVVYLTNGSILRGTIISYDLDKELILLIPQGSEIKIPAERIEKVMQVRYGKSKMVKDSEYAFKERGVYHSAMFHLSPGRTSWDGGALGLGAYYSAGFQFNRMLGVGGGIGADNYNVAQSETVYPLFVEARGYFLDKWKSPFYNVATGYAFAFRNRDQGILAASGGFYAYPSIGTRFSARASHNWSMDIGMKIQHAKWTRQIWNGQEVQEMWYKRVTLRLGLSF